MLTERENAEFTQVGPGTRMGDLMRRYWHPIAASAELSHKATKEVSVLGEELVLYKDRSGTIGLIGRRCPHRQVPLSYGVPEPDGIRCCYHGWKFDQTGHCTEAPFEDTVKPESHFRDRVRVPAYPVQEMGGLVFAYLGPEPAPLLPRWEPFRWPGAVHDIAFTLLPCSWLQCQENSLDPVHVEWLHETYSDYILERAGHPPRRPPDVPIMRHKQISFEVFEYGIIKRRVLDGLTAETEEWLVGGPAQNQPCNPVLFPNALLIGSDLSAVLQYRVPMDDNHTFHVSHYTWVPAPGKPAPRQERVPYRYVDLLTRDGAYRDQELTFNQDYMAWTSQGPIVRRDLERLGESDTGVILFRKLLREQMDRVRDGGEPVGVIRDPQENEKLEVPLERVRACSRGGVFAYRAAEGGSSEDALLINQILATWSD